jgi:PAS domain S-box-containing protein
MPGRGILGAPNQGASAGAGHESFGRLVESRGRRHQKVSVILLAYERDQDLAAIETLLESRGHRVLKARTGLEALEVARHDPPHAVVSDVLLPLLDGFALTRRLKEDPATRYLPVFLLSFRVEGPKYEAFAAEVGAQRFFPKGSTLEELTTALDSLKPGSDTMRIPALVPELLDRQEQDRRRVTELERQVRELQYNNKLLAAAERAARSKVERDAKERADLAGAESDRFRELNERIEELEARQQELVAAEAKAREAAEESRTGHARATVLEGRLAELQASRDAAVGAATDAERVFAAQPVAIVLSDMASHEIRAVSESAAALIGAGAGELRSRTLAEALPSLVPGEDGAWPGEIEIARPDGTRVVCELARTSVSSGGRACWLTAFTDVTAVRTGRAVLDVAKARAAALDAMPAAACVVDDEGRIGYSNAAFCTMLGLEPGGAEGAPLREFAADAGAGDGSVEGTGEARWRRKDGSTFMVEITKATVSEQPGTSVVVARDITPAQRERRLGAIMHRRGAGLLELARQTHALTEVEIPLRAAELAREITGSEIACVFLATADGGPFELAARSVAGAEPGPSLPVRWRGAVPADSAVGECASSRRQVIREGAEGTGTLRQAGLPGSFARQVVTPIVDGGRFVGILLLADKADAYEDEDGVSAAQVADGVWKALRRRRSDAEIVSAMDHMERVMQGAIEAIGTLSEAQDGCKTGRSRRVGELAAGIGTSMGLPGHTVRGLRVIGQLIDVGMLQIPREILWRPGALSAAEFELVRTHAERGFETLRRIDFPWPVAEAVRQHHERLDGSGYPRGLKGEEILLEARIVAVADAVEAMMAQRPQRQALSLAACIDELQGQAGRRYDAAVVRACVRLLRDRQPQPEKEAQAGQRIA